MSSKQNISIRFEVADLDKAVDLDLDLPSIARLALKRAIAKRSKKCPTCGQDIKDKK